MPLPLTTPVEQQRRPVSEGSTRPLAWRLEQLGRLEVALQERSDAVLEALATDLGKPAVEAFYELVAGRTPFGAAEPRCGLPDGQTLRAGV